MSYKIENGFRKNSYFDEKKYFDLLHNLYSYDPPNGFKKTDKTELNSFESLNFDNVIKNHGNKVIIENPKGHYKINGRSTVFIYVNENSEFEIEYSSSGTREFYFIKSNIKANITFQSRNNGIIYSYREFFISESTNLKVSNYVKNESGFFENINIFHLNGKNSFLDEKNSLDIYKGEGRLFSMLEHNVKSTKANSLAKAVLRDDSSFSIEGLIRINKKASTTDSYLNQHAILFDESTAYAFPALEIENNNVRASHSASVKRISEEDLFYMECRGINRKDAKEMIINGFLHL